MEQGKVVEEFEVKGRDGGRLKIVFRYPRIKDAGSALRMVNTIRREANYLGQRHPETLMSETDWLKQNIGWMKKKAGLALFVEVNGELSGDVSIRPSRFDVSKHVGSLGIMLREKYTGIGIGSRLMARVLELAKRETRFKIIDSGYFAKNKVSKKLHEKFGFRESGRLPNEVRLRNGSYCDHIYVYKNIKKL